MFALALLLVALHTGSISVSVFEIESGAILSGGAVDILDPAGNLRIAWANDEGVVRFSPLRPGKYRLRARHEDFVERQTEVVVKAAEDLQLSMKLYIAPATDSAAIVRTKPVWPQCFNGPRVDDLP